VVAREVKQRRDSIEQFRKAGRQDLLDREEGELHVLLAYQPEQLADVEVEALVRAVIAELGAQGPRDQGKVMGRQGRSRRRRQASPTPARRLAWLAPPATPMQRGPAGLACASTLR
jgi:uncharacterized protein YqeY